MGPRHREPQCAACAHACPPVLAQCNEFTRQDHKIVCTADISTHCAERSERKNRCQKTESVETAFGITSEECLDGLDALKDSRPANDADEFVLTGTCTAGLFQTRFKKYGTDILKGSTNKFERVCKKQEARAARGVLLEDRGRGNRVKIKAKHCGIHGALAARYANAGIDLDEELVMLVKVRGGATLRAALPASRLPARALQPHMSLMLSKQHPAHGVLPPCVWQPCSLPQHRWRGWHVPRGAPPQQRVRSTAARRSSLPSVLPLLPPLVRVLVVVVVVVVVVLFFFSLTLFLSPSPPLFFSLCVVRPNAAGKGQKTLRPVGCGHLRRGGHRHRKHVPPPCTLPFIPIAPGLPSAARGGKGEGGGGD